jgi:sugar O-acyltransferase (sialic acid O-acetyltransferase NeuD family)
MHTERIMLVGAGGHGRVVLDAMLASGIARESIVVADDNAARAGGDFLGFAVQVPVPVVVPGTRVHIAIGDGPTRQRVAERLQGSGAVLLTVVHPAAIVSPFATIGAGTFVAAAAVVGPAARVGEGAIINHGAIVDHDCIVEHHSHIAPHATLGGAVRVAAYVLVGAGAVVLPGIAIGERAVVGAGAAVVRNVSPQQTCVGVPARIIRGERA